MDRGGTETGGERVGHSPPTDRAQPISEAASVRGLGFVRAVSHYYNNLAGWMQHGPITNSSQMSDLDGGVGPAALAPAS